MCFESSQHDTGEQMRRQEEERQGRVRQASQTINDQFSRFTPDYFKNVSDAVRAYYFPQVDQQFKEAGRQNAYRYANNAASSAAARSSGNLVRDLSRARQRVEVQAQGTEDNARREVEGQRSRLLTLAEAGGTQENVAQQAAAAASANYAPTQFNPVTDFFREYTAQLANANIAQSQGYTPASFWTNQTRALRGSGASNVVGG